MFLFLVLVLLDDLYSEKNIKISGVYYEMLDVIGELKYAPVVDLKPLFELTLWSRGTHNLRKYGNGHLIAELLRGQGEAQLANMLQDFSLATDINFSASIKQTATKLSKNLADSKSIRPFKYIKKYIENFLGRFHKNNYEYEFDFQLKLAHWYFQNGRYDARYLNLHEAVVSSG